MTIKREYYSDSIKRFVRCKPSEILAQLVTGSHSTVEQTQVDAWLAEIDILRNRLSAYEGQVYFEYSIPRMGKRIDVILLIGAVIFVLEFKIGEKVFSAHSIDQVWDYALDLGNFHESSHDKFIAPILIATNARDIQPVCALTSHSDKLFLPIRCNTDSLRQALSDVLDIAKGPDLDASQWELGRYSPTPTIIEAALSLYRGHSVDEISRKDASAINLRETSEAISEVIRASKARSDKSICFVTGVPGAGKTLVGLNIATTHNDKSSDLRSVFLSGNGPLVTVLREALARDKVQNDNEHGRKIKKSAAMNEVKAFIQNVHHYRDEYVADPRPPIDHVALFDEAQRAWNLTQTSNFMHRRKNNFSFKQSEPEFLISCLDRHADWAVVVCLVGGGQEINTGEAGISEWVDSLNRSFPDWHVYLSSRLTDSEYGMGRVLDEIKSRHGVVYDDKLHLSVSMRSFRAEHVSLLVKQLLDLEVIEARQTLSRIEKKYPIVITRDLTKAKKWLTTNARGSERYGIVVSSQAERLKPHAIDVKSPVNPIHWFLHGKEDVRSSYYLENVATEFLVQGLELDWACVTWDADFRHTGNGWEYRSFRGSRWQRIKQPERQTFLKNAYRVLLTRARQGMVIVVPHGVPEDPTRKVSFYNPTFEYLQDIGFKVI